MLTKLKQRWRERSGYGEVLKIAFPLILSTGSWSVQHFIDRMFLTWYSPQAIAASMPAGLLFWTVISLFVGMAVYVNTFVAQYYGAKRKDRVGPSVWQGMYLSVLVAILIIPFYQTADWLFAIFDHPFEVQRLELIYFRILLYGAPFMVIANAISSFFSGLGKTWTVMWVNFLGTGVNLFLDYLLIFGNWGFPELGMEGAGWATSAAAVVIALTFFVLMAKPKYNRVYHTLKGWQFDRPLFRRLVRYGLPNGMQFLLELLAFSAFFLLIGKLGTRELAASNIAININTLAFMPMVGLSIAVSTLVGQRLGENEPQLAEKATWSSFHLAFIFFTGLGFAYFLVPDVFIWPFAVQADAASFTAIHQLTRTLLTFVAFYCLFDAGNMVFSGALKGAGDTRFVAIASVGLSWLVMIIPATFSVFILEANIYWMWSFLTLYIIALCLVFYWRFKHGFWKSLRVIESDEGGEIPAALEAMD